MVFPFLLLALNLGFNNALSIIDPALTDLSQEDPKLLEVIKSSLLIKPSWDTKYNFTKTSVDLRGQYGQPVEVEKLFQGKKNGFFIEAGAYDGEIYSNSLLFELRHNWTGILVEPNHDNFQNLLSKNRKAYAIETCLSFKPSVTQVDFDAAGIFGGIINGKFRPGDTSHDMLEQMKARSSKFKPQFPYERKIVKMQCLPLTSLILALGNPTIDYLSLDVEGVELQILQSLDFDKLNINVISVETNHIGSIFDGTQTQLAFLLRRNGYVLHSTVEIDDIYVKQEFLSQLRDEL